MLVFWLSFHSYGMFVYSFMWQVFAKCPSTKKSVVWCFRGRWGGKGERDKQEEIERARQKRRGREKSEGTSEREEEKGGGLRGKMKARRIAALIIFISVHVVQN